MTGMSIVAVLTVIGLVIGLTPNPDNTEIKSLDAITGYTFNVQANLMVDPHYVGILDPTGIVTFRFNDDNHFLLTVHSKGLEGLCETCSIRVETSTSCTERAIGLGLWNPQFHHKDPWDLLHYTSRNGITNTYSSSHLYGRHSRDYRGTCHMIVVITPYTTISLLR
jgi:hypothetical protein